MHFKTYVFNDAYDGLYFSRINRKHVAYMRFILEKYKQ